MRHFPHPEVPKSEFSTVLARVPDLVVFWEAPLN